MSVVQGRRGGRSGNQRGDGGQTLVEFAMVFPVFLLLMFGIIEFAFVFNAMLGISYATRDAALIAAEAGSGLPGYDNGADCAIIHAVDDAVGPPANDNRINEVVIYKADRNGVEIAGVSNRWTRGSSTSCPDGSTIPYRRLTYGYREGVDANDIPYRCNWLGGCGTGRPLDTIGVRVTYVHQWVTPLGGFGGNGFSGQGGSGFTLTQSNSMRMEPIL